MKCSMRKSLIPSFKSQITQSFLPYSFFPDSYLENLRESVQYCFQEVHDSSSDSVFLFLNGNIYAEHGLNSKESSASHKFPEKLVEIEKSTEPFSPVRSLILCYLQIFARRRFEHARLYLVSKRPQKYRKTSRKKSDRETSGHFCDQGDGNSADIDRGIHANGLCTFDSLGEACRHTLGMRLVEKMHDSGPSLSQPPLKERFYLEGRSKPPGSRSKGMISMYELKASDINFLMHSKNIKIPIVRT